MAINEGLLSGCRVVEIAHPLTEYAGLVLAGLGADVYLVEPPQGSATRNRNPVSYTHLTLPTILLV